MQIKPILKHSVYPVYKFNAMKKLVFLFAILPFLFFSCKKEYIPIPNNGQTILLDVPSSSWETFDNGVTYSVPLNIPEITDYFNSNGQVSVYISYGNGVYEQIPEVYNDVTYSFTSNPGNVTVYAQDLTKIGMLSPDNATIKIVLTN